MQAAGVGRRAWGVVFLLTALCVLAYWRGVSLPLISDDYIQLQISLQYAGWRGWAELAHDALYRCRATSILLTQALWSLFGLNGLAYNLTSLALHVINTLLVCSLGRWNRLGWPVAIAAAAFFAISERHQEAVLWFAAVPEQLVFTCVVAAFSLWIGWLQTGSRSQFWFALAFVALGFLSKESGVVAVPLMAGASWLERHRRPMPWFTLAMLSFACIAYFLAGYVAKSDHLHYNDGTFSLAAPFWLTTPKAIGRILWVWGSAACIVLLLARQRELVAMALGWMAVTLMPYSFLLYQTQVPSRHTYLAGVGAAWIVGAAVVHMMQVQRFRAVAAVLSLAILGQQCTYLWVRKHEQYLDRAQPTELLLSIAKEDPRPIYLECFRYSPWVAKAALEVGLGEVVEMQESSTMEDAQVVSGPHCTAKSFLLIRNRQSANGAAGTISPIGGI
jgi:hypothetical protein